MQKGSLPERLEWEQGRQRDVGGLGNSHLGLYRRWYLSLGREMGVKASWSRLESQRGGPEILVKILS